ncbi:hypothetical protein DRF60_10995 [Chryseobacterium elymi]|uniref:Uncharacterized protein n=1 Tax=Chryseobacterium elymi TaxID=395936 RepID=A0A3D9DHV7_9FLAO|nr:hypothetical protein [Chryseobacterium elymi]REC77506.1 hypothetical protein DRF60_10995 [Chryseobacterium elymi]
MKKNVSLLVLILSGFLSFGNAQVGVSTANPQGTFHIDGAKDNPAVGAPSVTQQANDMVVTNTGSLGVGITVPTTKMHIVTTAADLNRYTLIDAPAGGNNLSILALRNTSPLAAGNFSLLGFTNSGPTSGGANWGIGSMRTSTAEDFFMGNSLGGGYLERLRITSSGNVGIGTSSPTELLDVAGHTRVRTMDIVAGTNAVTPVYTDSNGVLVKASPSETFGAVLSSPLNNLASGATGQLITGLSDGGFYKAVVIVGDGCGNVAIAEYYVINSTASSLYSINGLGGNQGSGNTAKSPIFNEISRYSISTAWTDVVGCADGGNPSALNYTLTMPSAGTINITNNGNVTRGYKIILTRY